MKKITFTLICLSLVVLSYGQTIDWSYNIGFSIRPQSPAIALDGTIYIGSEDNANFHAINPDGSLKWVYTDISDNVYASASIAVDGTIYVGAQDNFLHAINPDGTQKWTLDLGADIRLSTPAIANDGTIYVGSFSDNLYAINPDGAEKWTFPTGGNVQSTPSIANDGTIYVGSDDDNLYAINPDGTQKWVFPVSGNIQSGIAIQDDGVLIVGVDQGGTTGAVFAINPDGTQKWSKIITGRISVCSPALAIDGTIYIGTKEGNNLLALNPSDGSTNWEYITSDIINSSPVVGNDGLIYFGSFDNNLYALNPDGSLNFSVDLNDNIWSSPAIKDGILYVGSYDGNLYAIDIPSTNLADSDWPMFGKNLQHNSSSDTGPSLKLESTSSPKTTKVFYTEGVLNLSVSDFNKTASVSVFDALGRKIKTQSVDFKDNQINQIRLQNTNTGLYFVKITDNVSNTPIITKRFIIVR